MNKNACSQIVVGYYIIIIKTAQARFSCFPVSGEDDFATPKLALKIQGQRE